MREVANMYHTMKQCVLVWMKDREALSVLNEGEKEKSFSRWSPSIRPPALLPVYSHSLCSIRQCSSAPPSDVINGLEHSLIQQTKYSHKVFMVVKKSVSFISNQTVHISEHYRALQASRGNILINYFFDLITNAANWLISEINSLFILLTLLGECRVPSICIQ